MTTIVGERTRFDPAFDAVFAAGRPVFACAVAAFGVETIVCARVVSDVLGDRYSVVPLIPWLPAVAWLAYACGFLWLACAAALLFDRSMRVAAIVFASAFLLCTLVLDVPKAAEHFGSIGLRTIVFEPLSIACFALLMPATPVGPPALVMAARVLLGIAQIVFGYDHFLALAYIANLLPAWIPFHVFFAGFFGVALVAAGLSIALNYLTRWSGLCLGAMFAIWVVTLHLPRVLGWYAVPGATQSPAEWQSLMIAVAFCGGSWALARNAK